MEEITSRNQTGDAGSSRKIPSVPTSNSPHAVDHTDFAMNISVLDGGNYFRGLLLLIAKDHTISVKESEMMKDLGRALGLEREFCEEAIRDILENKYISDSPPEFSSQELARMFIRDGFTFATADDEVHSLEEEWLRKTATANGLDDNWVSEQKAEALKPHEERRLEAYRLRVQYRG